LIFSQETVTGGCQRPPKPFTMGIFWSKVVYSKLGHEQIIQKIFNIFTEVHTMLQ